MDLGEVLNLILLALVAIGALAWRLVGLGAERAVTAQVEELVSELNRASVLARELEKTRATERQELRFESYGALWAEMKPLAIYDDSPVDPGTMQTLSKALSTWYFSAKGGLMLTSHNRELYFALQDLVSSVADQPGWEGERTRDPRRSFLAVLDREELASARALIDHLERTDISTWPEGVEPLARGWHADVKAIAKEWPRLESAEHFAVLQQVASVLRASLTFDVESRLR